MKYIIVPDRTTEYTHSFFATPFGAKVSFPQGWIEFEPHEVISRTYHTVHYPFDPVRIDDKMILAIRKSDYKKRFP